MFVQMGFSRTAPILNPITLNPLFLTFGNMGLESGVSGASRSREDGFQIPCSKEIGVKQTESERGERRRRRQDKKKTNEKDRKEGEQAACMGM